MASTTTTVIDRPLPTKKRRPSLESNSNSNSSQPQKQGKPESEAKDGGKSDHNGSAPNNIGRFEPSVEQPSESTQKKTVTESRRGRASSITGTQSTGGGSGGNSKGSIAENRLPSKKRKGSHDSLSLQGGSGGGGAGGDVNKRRKGSQDLSVSFEDDDRLPGSRKGSIDFSIQVDLLPRKFSYDASLGSNGTPKFEDLFAAAAEPLFARGENAEEEKSQGSATAPSLPPPASLEHLDELGVRSTSTTDKQTYADKQSSEKHPPSSSLNQNDIHDDEDVDDEDASSASTTQKLLFETILGGSCSGLFHQQGSRAADGGRDRLESWGGMSDLSFPPGGGSDPATAASALASGTWTSVLPPPAQHLQSNGVEGTVDEMLHGASETQEDSKPSAVPGGISLYQPQRRDRFNSLASLSEMSAFNGARVLEGNEVVVGSDIQSFVAAAMASVSDQLAGLAGVIENVAGIADTIAVEVTTATTSIRKTSIGEESETSSVVSPLIGAVSDTANHIHYRRDRSNSVSGRANNTGRSRSDSIASSAAMSLIDYDAVEAAVNAAEAVTGILDLGNTQNASVGLESASESHGSGQSHPKKARPTKEKAGESNSATRTVRSRRKLPLKRKRCESHASSTSSLSADDGKKEQQSGKARRKTCRFSNDHTRSGGKQGSASSRKASFHSDDVSNTDSGSSRAPFKKRAHRPSSPQNASKIDPVAATPKLSNRTTARCNEDDPPELPLPPAVVSSSAPKRAPKASADKKGACKKWEGMFEALLEFIDERRQEETKDLDEAAREAWVWDGNVPTTYKTKDGKALGRWVNNQRTARAKGTLKGDREERLIAAGLKWSVLTSNSWNEMLEELRIYVAEYTKDGKEWDGNVPTCYQIKSRPDGEFAGEDKNLGRWVNRQRSMYQTGKLRKDRQLALEKLGLKWSVLATTSWDGMFETLQVYIHEQTKNGAVWDGNVAATYRTNDDPPRNLGRWVNRQRSAYVKNKLKQEWIDRLNSVGLKWSVNQRHSGPTAATATGSRKSSDQTSSKTPDKTISNEVGAAVGVNESVSAQGGETAGEDDDDSVQAVDDDILEQVANATVKELGALDDRDPNELKGVAV